MLFAEIIPLGGISLFTRSRRGLDDLERKPLTTPFIDGNHEWHPCFMALPAEDFYAGIVQRHPDHLREAPPRQSVL
jgi:hypothetical protein